MLAFLLPSRTLLRCPRRPGLGLHKHHDADDESPEQPREGGDDGRPVVLDQPDSPAAEALRSVADNLARRQASLVGRPLGLTPSRA